MITERENWLRAVEFRGPEWIPVEVGFSRPTWRHHRERLEEVLLRHPLLFPGYEAGSTDFDALPEGPYRQGEITRDHWGCVWKNVQEGFEGMCIGHPLEDWAALDAYTPPDPLTTSEWGVRNWDEIARWAHETKARGEVACVWAERLFDRLYNLRGFENLHD